MSHTDTAAPCFSGEDSSQSSAAPPQQTALHELLQYWAFPQAAVLQELLQCGSPTGCSPSGAGCSSLNLVRDTNPAPAWAPLCGATGPARSLLQRGALSQCCSTLRLCLSPRPGSSKEQTPAPDLLRKVKHKNIFTPCLLPPSCPEAHDLSDPMNQDSGQVSLP